MPPPAGRRPPEPPGGPLRARVDVRGVRRPGHIRHVAHAGCDVVLQIRSGMVHVERVGEQGLQLGRRVRVRVGIRHLRRFRGPRRRSREFDRRVRRDDVGLGDRVGIVAGLRDTHVDGGVVRAGGPVEEGISGRCGSGVDSRVDDAAAGVGRVTVLCPSTKFGGRGMICMRHALIERG